MGAGWNARRVYELARGKYFKWAAVDDLIEPDLLQRCVEVLESDPGCVVAYASTKEVDQNGKFIKNYVTPIRTDYDDPVSRFRGLLMTGGHMCYQIYGLMRMSALKRIPPMGSYVDADGVLLARMSLLGRFYEIPECLFISRRHVGQSSTILPARLRHPARFRLTNRHGWLPCPEWWDPAKTRALTFPEFRLLAEYILSIYHAPLSAGKKLRCYSMLLPWIKIHFRPMLKDLVIAADQVVYNFQVSNVSIPESEMRETRSDTGTVRH